MSASTAPFLSRLLAFFIVIGCFYGVLFASRLTTNLTRKEGFNVFWRSLDAGDVNGAKEALLRIEETTRITDRLPLPPFEPFPMVEADRAIHRVDKKLEALGELLAGKRSSQNINQVALTFSPTDREEFSVLLERLRSHYSEVDSLRREQSQIASDEDLTWTKVRFLKKDFRILLNLPEKETEDSLELYPDGYLQGLPHLEELPVSLMTPSDLREALEANKTPLPTIPPEEFGEALSKLRSGMAEALADFDAIEERASKAKGELQAVRKKIRDLLEELKSYVVKSVKGDLRQIA